MKRSLLDLGSWTLGVAVLGICAFELYFYQSDIANTQGDRWTEYSDVEALINIGPGAIVGISCFLAPFLAKLRTVEVINYTVTCLMGLYVLCVLIECPKSLFSWTFLTLVVAIIALRSVVVLKLINANGSFQE